MTCDKCNKATVPYVVHESDMARLERSNRRLWITNLVLIAVILAGFIWFSIWRDQWEMTETTTIEAEQESESGNNYAVGGDFEWHVNE